ncbi:MAG: hypothetical protein L0220_03355 [Acidobacteria bacterium]|nr:hypothetical protein [Acidobacteriota bacterium]
MSFKTTPRNDVNALGACAPRALTEEEIMFRLLIVEDDENTLNQLQKLFDEEFPDAIVDTAATIKKGMLLIEEAFENRCYYDAAILDLKLPLDVGEAAEVDELVCHKIRNLMPDALIVHYTGYPEDKQILQHVKNAHTGPHDPRTSIISKLKSGWSIELLRKAKMYLYGCRIEKQIDLLFGSRSREPSGGSLTHNIAMLQRDIIVHWNDLDQMLQERIKSIFHVDADSLPIRISLIDRSSSD